MGWMTFLHVRTHFKGKHLHCNCSGSSVDRFANQRLVHGDCYFHFLVGLRAPMYWSHLAAVIVLASRGDLGSRVQCSNEWIHSSQVSCWSQIGGYHSGFVLPSWRNTWLPSVLLPPSVETFTTSCTVPRLIPWPSSRYLLPSPDVPT